MTTLSAAAETRLTADGDEVYHLPQPLSQTPPSFSQALLSPRPCGNNLRNGFLVLLKDCTLAPQDRSPHSPFVSARIDTNTSHYNRLTHPPSLPSSVRESSIVLVFAAGPSRTGIYESLAIEPP